MNWLERFASLDGQLWLASIMNAVFIFAEFRVVMIAKTTEGLSTVMIFGFLWMQIVYCVAGYRDKRRGMFWGMLLSASGSVLIILRIVHLYWR